MEGNVEVLPNVTMSTHIITNSSHMSGSATSNHTVNDLIQYYKMMGITDYPKNKDGRPNMSRLINKNNLKKLNQRENLNRIETLNTASKVTLNEECPICNDPFHDMCILKCGHKFCINCAISHFRVKHNCPLCRTEICSIPKTLTPICDDYIEAISENVFNQLDERRDYLSMKGYLLNRLTFYKRNHVLNVDRFINDIYSEIMTNIFTISDNISEWYMSS